jgi:hypothetical protein
MKSIKEYVRFVVGEGYSTSPAAAAAIKKTNPSSDIFLLVSIHASNPFPLKI